MGGTAGSGAFTSTATGNTFAGWNLEVAGAGVGRVRALILSSFAVSVTTIDALTDVGTINHAAGALIVADGTKFEEVALSGPFNLAATGLLVDGRGDRGRGGLEPGGCGGGGRRLHPGLGGGRDQGGQAPGRGGGQAGPGEEQRQRGAQGVIRRIVNAVVGELKATPRSGRRSSARRSAALVGIRRGSDPRG